MDTKDPPAIVLPPCPPLVDFMAHPFALVCICHTLESACAAALELPEIGGDLDPVVPRAIILPADAAYHVYARQATAWITRTQVLATYPHGERTVEVQE